ncbi:MAG: short-chain dehydrogenase [Polyangiaceae bacterium]|jgi:NAD(P)-dependent dehydrogenase (short-subunit alcohol dehydrogenase family)|nr:short-chain dehydrogenase [Polyangiaceae bacterium]
MSNDILVFSGVSALVTGASRGLGKALALQLAAAGARVVLVARSAAELSSVAEAIRAQGGEAHALPADVSRKEDTYAIAGAAAALVGPVDLLIHNASALGPTPLRLLLDTDCEDLQSVLETNVVGPFRLSKAVGGSMALRKTGTILHVSSDASVNAYERWGAYSVSKAALDHLSRIWAAELEERGVRVLSVDPGEMATMMHQQAVPDADPSTLSSPSDVASRILRMLADPSVKTGRRVEAQSWREAS